MLDTRWNSSLSLDPPWRLLFFFNPWNFRFVSAACESLRVVLLCVVDLRDKRELADVSLSQLEYFGLFFVKKNIYIQSVQWYLWNTWKANEQKNTRNPEGELHSIVRDSIERGR